MKQTNGSTEDLFDILDKKIKCKFINFASKINPPEEITALKTAPLITLNNHYLFTSLKPIKKHYLLSFWEKLQTKINLFFSKN